MQSITDEVFQVLTRRVPEARGERDERPCARAEPRKVLLLAVDLWLNDAKSLTPPFQHYLARRMNMQSLFLNRRYIIKRAIYFIDLSFMFMLSCLPLSQQ